MSNPVADGARQSITPAPHLLGHYARPTRELTADEDPRSLPVLAALAAIETSARLGRYLPVSVGQEQARDMAAAHDAGAAHHVNWSHWSQWDDAQVRHRPAQEGLLLLTAAQDSMPPNRSLAIELTHRQVDLAATHSGVAVRIVCRIGNGSLLVTTLCDRNDPWAQACNAVAEMYAEILHALLNDRSTAPAGASGIGAASRGWVLGALSGRAHDHGEFIAIPHLIESSVDRDPDRVAYCFGDRSLSYRRFDGMANALAALLRERGVSRGSTVAVLLANSLAMPVAYQALMKLGAAFVPLDPGWPPQRLHDTLELIAGKVILCVDADAAPSDFREQTLAVDIDALVPLSHRPNIGLRPEDRIYGFFTSGTTGRPKCAINNHRGLLNRFRFMSRYFDGGRGDERVLQNTRHTFDSSVWQLFWPLTTGGSVVIPQQGAFLDLEATIETIARHRITMTDFVPSVFNQVVALAERQAQIRARLGSLRELIVGGEEITPHMVHKLRAILPLLRITNAYGPTETSIGMVFHPVETADGSQIPLGRPIDNCHIVVVDEALRPLPQGACGELLIGGACVGNGYLGDAHRTAQVFIPNPFESIPGAVLYRSGDLGCFDSLGRLRFAGRRDSQVKIGGVRIELGEIEAAAQQCAHVHDAKALVAGSDGAKSLAVFVTGDAQLNAAQLERQLRELLPRHSVPRHVLVLPEMPLTDGAKVDRRRLQRLLDAHLARQAAAAGAMPSAADGDPLLQRILGVFRRGLQRPNLRPDDHFFDIGGDSLQACNTAMELAHVCSVRFGVHDLFDCPSASLARARIGALLHAPPAFEADEYALMEGDAAACAGLSLPQAGSIELGRPRRIFVTGATGFVGAYLVHELLLRSDAEVFALCRSSGRAQQRLVDSLQARRLWDERFAGRLHAVEGDLAQPRLGVDDRTWHRLAGECDAVVHCAALVNFLYDYAAHRDVNVLGTHEVLNLALDDRAKPLHFISTLGTLDKEAARHGTPLGEPFDPAQAVAPDSGYSRSKWVAERLLLAARAQGAPVTVFRLGEVMPCGAHGLPNERALTHLLLSAFVQLGAKPDAAIRSDWSPVSDVARHVIAAVFDGRAWNRNYHVFHPESVCFAQALERAGLAFETLSCNAWLARLEQHIAGGAPRGLTLLRGFLPQRVGDEAALAAAFASLLTDNPRLFQRTACIELAQAHRLHDGDVDGAIAAYARSLRGLEAPRTEPPTRRTTP